MKAWSLRDVTSLVGKAAVGFAVMFIAIYQAAGKATVAAQLPWASWAVGGLVVVGISNGLWLLALRQAVQRRYRLLVAGPALERLRSVSPRPAAHVSFDNSALVAARGMTRYHRPTCLLASGKTVRSSTRTAHQRAGRRPCGVCEP